MEHGRETNRLAASLNTIGMIVLGLILAITPLALWVAWTVPLFVMVVAVGGTAGVLICGLARTQVLVPPQSGLPDLKRKDIGFDKLVTALTNAHPMIHHHRGRRLGELAFWRSEDADGPTTEIKD